MNNKIIIILFSTIFYRSAFSETPPLVSQSMNGKVFTMPSLYPAPDQPTFVLAKDRHSLYKSEAGKTELLRKFKFPVSDVFIWHKKGKTNVLVLLEKVSFKTIRHSRGKDGFTTVMRKEVVKTVSWIVERWDGNEWSQVGKEVEGSAQGIFKITSSKIEVGGKNCVGHQYKWNFSKNNWTPIRKSPVYTKDSQKTEPSKKMYHVQKKGRK